LTTSVSAQKNVPQALLDLFAQTTINKKQKDFSLLERKTATQFNICNKQINLISLLILISIRFSNQYQYHTIQKLLEESFYPSPHHPIQQKLFAQAVPALVL